MHQQSSKNKPSNTHKTYLFFGVEFWSDLEVFWRHFSSKIAFLSEQRAPKNGSKKGCPPLRKQGARTDYDHGPGLPDSPPRVRAFLNKKQLSEQETRTAAHFWIHFRALFLEWAIFWFHVWKKDHFLMKSETKKTSYCRFLCYLFLSKGWWSDTLWAKARRISPFHLLIRQPYPLTSRSIHQAKNVRDLFFSYIFLYDFPILFFYIFPYFVGGGPSG